MTAKTRSALSTEMGTDFATNGTGAITAAIARGYFQDVIDSSVNVTDEKGQPSGVATLDGSGKLVTSQIPAALVGALQYQGTWNANTNSPALASGTGTKGQYYKVSVAGTTAIDGISQWNVGDEIIFDGTTWDRVDGAGEVVSVAGRTGAVTLAAGDVSGLAASATTDATNAGNISSGTLAAARGGAGTISGALKGNGSGVVSQAATSDLSDVSGPSVAAPTDASGATGGPLTLTNNGSYVYKHGKEVLWVIDITYQTTADTHSAALGTIPFAPNSNLALADMGVLQGATAGWFFALLPGSGTINLYTDSTLGIHLTNANLSGKNIRLALKYFTN